MALFRKKVSQKPETDTTPEVVKMSATEAETLQEASAPKKRTRTKKADAVSTASASKRPKASTAKVASVASARAAHILRRPRATEKSASLATSGVYVFEVAPTVGKVEVAQAVHALYGVRPRRVNMICQSGKRVRFGGRKGQRKDWKKAFVYLKSGDSMDVFDVRT